MLQNSAVFPQILHMTWNSWASTNHAWSILIWWLVGCFLSSAGWAFHIRWSQLCRCVCLDMNRGETSHNCCTQRLVILHAQTYEETLITCQKPGQSDLLYGSKSYAEKSGHE